MYNTRMNIQAHPCLPPVPSSWSIAAASKPEKALAKAAEAKKAAILVNVTQYPDILKFMQTGFAAAFEDRRKKDKEQRKEEGHLPQW